MFECKLNKRFSDAVKNPGNVKWVREKEKSYWGDAYYRWSLKSGNEIVIKQYGSGARTLACCGITELVFTPLQNGSNKYPENRDNFEQIVASYIWNTVSNTDQRIVIVGIPTDVGNQSQYRLSFYTQLREVLIKFGFQETSSTPYRNQNSKNKIIVLVGQMPTIRGAGQRSKIDYDL